MTHGDDSGLFLPPRVAPYPAVIDPITSRKGDVKRWSSTRHVRCSRHCVRRACASTWTTAHPAAGWKYTDCEMRGVPVRLEIAPRDVEKDQVRARSARRPGQAFVPVAGVAAAALDLLEALQRDLLARARRFVADNTTPVTAWGEFKEVMASRRGFLLAPFCRDASCEARIKEETKATVRVIPLGGEERPGACVRCGSPSPRDVLLRAGLLTAPRGARRRRRPRRARRG